MTDEDDNDVPLPDIRAHVVFGLALIVALTRLAMCLTCFARGAISERYVGQQLFTEAWYN